jgi:hypothetical protein
MKELFTLFLLAISLTTFAQQRACVWYFGQNGAGLDFKCNLQSQYGAACIIRWKVAHQFPTLWKTYFSIPVESRLRLWQKSSHDANGFGIGRQPECWGSSTQGALIIPQPGVDSLYYIFTVDVETIQYQMLSAIASLIYIRTMAMVM